MTIRKGRKTGYRFERKFCTQLSKYEVEHIVKTNPEIFSEIFHERHVNNIYLDTPNLTFFYENNFGKSQRKKVRIRWYGDLYGSINKPVLEFKIKEGLVGYKISFLLEPFELNENFDIDTLSQVFRNSYLPDWVTREITELEPKLLNSYTRKYFRSFNKLFRITIDKDLIYHDIQKRNNTFLKKHIDYNEIILELKYAFDDDKHANTITSAFPFRLVKSSKYVNGVSYFHINLAV